MTEERRLVTVLFADVVGSTSLGESLDPEDVRALLGRLFGIARGSVADHGGRLEKFIGDAIMAVFGLPTAHDDDPARAIRAALDLRDRVRADPFLQDRIAIRLGVNSGEVIATREAEADQFLITGDPVNTAARLEQAADPWVILVGERTVRAVGERFEFGAPVAVQAKGKSRPVVARPVEGIAASPAHRPSALRLIGRSPELEQLELAGRRAFDERRPFLVTIVAPAGVGKSRLLEEFLALSGPGTRVALAQCLPYGQRLTYWPMRAILLEILGLGDDSTPDELHETLRHWLEAAGEPESDRTAALLAATVGAGEGESADRSADRIALHAAWRRFVELAAEQAPLILVIEDLHWSSDSLLDLVEAILQPRADVPLLMIALARPELLDRRPSWGGGRRNAISIALEPLSEDSIAVIVADLIGRPSPAIVEAVVARAEGNPFYAGEIVRALGDRLGPGLDPDPEAIAAAVASLPDTVQATVLARLDALAPVERRIIQLGAVLGRTFSGRAIPALDDALTPEIVAGAIDDLIERDLVRSTGRDQLTFRHILIREVAYGTLPRAERARLHGLAGTWIEREAEASGRQDELAELVAFHLREAATMTGLLGEAPSTELAERAVRWLRRAAALADAGAANVEAARHLQAAIELAPRDLLPALHEDLGDVWVGGEQALNSFLRAYELGRELGLDDDQRLRTIAKAVNVRARWGGSVGDRSGDQRLEARVTEIERLLAGKVSDDARLWGLLALAQRSSSGEVPLPETDAERRSIADEAIALATAMGLPDQVSAALDARGAAEMAGDRFVEALEIELRREELFDRIATPERIDALSMVAWLSFSLGDLGAAEQAVTRARAGFAIEQAPGWISGGLAWRVAALHWLGRWDEALADANKMALAWRASEIRGPWYLLQGVLAALAINRARGDAIGVARWREAAETIFRNSDPAILSQRLAAYVEGRLGDLETTVVDEFRRFTPRVDHPATAIALLADHRQPGPTGTLDAIVERMGERKIRLVESQARRLRGIRAGSPDDLAAALGLFESMGARPYIARTRSELGLVAGDGAMVESALADLEALGDIEQATRVAGESTKGAWWLPPRSAAQTS